jgi:hypothetical protein
MEMIASGYPHTPPHTGENYEIWQSVAGGEWTLLKTIDSHAGKGQMSEVVDGLAPGTDYAFRVRAVTFAQTSLPSLHVDVSTLRPEGSAALIDAPETAEEGAFNH